MPRRALILVMALSFAGLGCTPAFNWREVRSVDHGFSVLLPAKAVSMTRTIDLDGLSITMTLTGARTEECLFSVGSARLPRDEATLREHALRSMRTAMLRNVQADAQTLGAEPQRRAIDRTDSSGAVTGRVEAWTVQASGKLAEQKIVLQAIFVAHGDRIWQAVAITPPALSAQAQTMLDSFRVSD